MSVIVFVEGAKLTVMELQPYSVRTLSHTTIFTFDCGSSVFRMVAFPLMPEILDNVSPADEMIAPTSRDFSGYWLNLQATGTSTMALPSFCSLVEKLYTSLKTCSLSPLPCQ